MAKLPKRVADFLSGQRYAVAGVSRGPNATANAVYRKLLGAGYDVVPVNPAADEVEGVVCYRDLVSIPDALDGVVAVTPARAAVEIVRQCEAKGVKRVWFHRSFGEGSVSAEAVKDCKARGIDCIAGGCPLMYCAPVDFGHRCMRWWLRLQGRVPG